MAIPVSLHYACDELPGKCYLWYIHCPICGAKLFILCPKIRVIPCPACGHEFIEGGIG